MQTTTVLLHFRRKAHLELTKVSQLWSCHDCLPLDRIQLIGIVNYQARFAQGELSLSMYFEHDQCAIECFPLESVEKCVSIRDTELPSTGVKAEARPWMLSFWQLSKLLPY